MQENREHQNFHVGLKAFIGDGEKLLILQDEDGLWELPGGRTEKIETSKELQEILRREISEELGENVQYTIGPVFHAWIRKPFGLKQYKDKADFCIFLIGFRCAYKNGRPSLSEEHTGFRWITKDEVEDLQFENTYKEAVQKYFQSP